MTATLRMTLVLAGFLLFGVTAHAGCSSPVDDRRVSFLSQRFEMDPLDTVAGELLAEALFERYRRTRKAGDLHAVGVALQALRLADPVPRHRLVEVRFLRAEHRFREALATLEALERDGAPPSDSRALLFLRADLMLDLGRADDAAQTITALEQGESNAETWFRRAELLKLRGEPQAALVPLRQAIAAAIKTRESPRDARWFQIALGEQLFQMGRLAEARQIYMELAENCPDDPSLQDHLAELQAAQGDVQEALQIYETLAKTYEHAPWWETTGILHLLARKPRSAQPWLEKAKDAYLRSRLRGERVYVHHFAELLTDYFGAACAGLALAREELAERRVRATLELVAWSAFKCGDPKLAQQTAREALALPTTTPLSDYRLGLVLAGTGDLAEGAAMVRAAREKNPWILNFHAHR